MRLQEVPRKPSRPRTDQTSERHRACRQRLARRLQIQPDPRPNQSPPKSTRAVPQVQIHRAVARPTQRALRFQTCGAPPFPKAPHTNQPPQAAKRMPQNTLAVASKRWDAVDPTTSSSIVATAKIGKLRLSPAITERTEFMYARGSPETRKITACGQ